MGADASPRGGQLDRCEPWPAHCRPL